MYHKLPETDAEMLIVREITGTPSERSLCDFFSKDKQLDALCLLLHFLTLPVK